MSDSRAVRSSILAALTGLSILAAGSAVAGENPYAQVGSWSVTSFTAAEGFAFCAATVNNGRAKLAVATDGKMWQVGVPFKGAKRNIEIYYGFGVAGEVGRFDAAGDGMAVMRVSRDQVEAFGSAPTFDVDVNGTAISWKLAGGGAAIAKTVECVRNRGIAGAAAATGAPAMPAPLGSGRNCPAPGKYRSKTSSRAVEVTFFNGGSKPATFYWIDFAGQWKKYHTVKPNSHVVQKTYATHPWVATDPKGNCHREVFMPDPSGNAENNNFQVWFD